MNTIKHNASFKKPIESGIAVLSSPLPAPSATKPIDYPYGMPMNASRRQSVSSAIVGTNAMIGNPKYTAPINSVPQMANILVIALMIIWLNLDSNHLLPLSHIVLVFLLRALRS
jgi:hypothetical protein